MRPALVLFAALVIGCAAPAAAPTPAPSVAVAVSAPGEVTLDIPELL